MDNVVLVVPCYNEANRLDLAAFRSAVESLDGLHLLFVNDGSSDATGNVLRSLVHELPAGRGDVLALEKNVGKAEAVRRGVTRALDERTPDLGAVGYWDADLSTPLEAVEDLAGMLEKDDRTLAVIGSRVKLMGRDIDRWALRHYSGRVFATLAALALGFPVYDTQCGAKLFRPTDDIRAVFEEPFATRWAFDVEILARLANRHGRDLGDRRIVVEHPLRQWVDVPGSKIKLRDLPGMLRDVLLVYRRY